LGGGIEKSFRYLSEVCWRRDYRKNMIGVNMIRILSALLALGLSVPVLAQAPGAAPSGTIKVSNILVSYDDQVQGNWPGQSRIISVNSPEIIELFISPASSGVWGEGLLGSKDRVIEPGHNQEFPVEGGNYDIMIVDDLNREYILYDLPVSGVVCWAVTLEYMGEHNYSEFEEYLGGDVAPVALLYSLDQNTDENSYWVWPETQVYCSLSSSTEWGERIDTPAISMWCDRPFVFYVPAGNRYDIRVESHDGAHFSGNEVTYTRFEVFVGAGGYYWIVSPRDMDD